MWELEDVPSDSCPLVEAQCEISFDTRDGDHYVGTVAASFATDGAGYVLLTGVGELQRECSRNCDVSGGRLSSAEGGSR